MPSHLSFLIANAGLFLHCTRGSFADMSMPCLQQELWEMSEGSKQPILVAILTGRACPETGCHFYYTLYSSVSERF